MPQLTFYIAFNIPLPALQFSWFSLSYPYSLLSLNHYFNRICFLTAQTVMHCILCLQTKKNINILLMQSPANSSCSCELVHGSLIRTGLLVEKVNLLMGMSPVWWCVSWLWCCEPRYCQSAGKGKCTGDKQGPGQNDAWDRH